MSLTESLYAWLVRLDRFLKVTHRLPVPVISVGNLSVGGRGKTPLVVAIVQRLKAKGLRPVVLTRGYGRASRQPRMIETGQEFFLNAREVGDEPLEIFCRTRCPVLVAANRVELAKSYLKDHRGLDGLVFVLDDGFQHWSLARDLNIAIVADEDFSDRLLPLGRLRERPDALDRADLVLKSGKDLIKESRWDLEPEPGHFVHVLTTRAPDSEYKEFFSHRENIQFVELSDHATAEDIFEALGDLPGGELVVGMKEATKLFSWEQLTAFFEKKEAWLPMSENQFHVTLVDLELQIVGQELDVHLDRIATQVLGYRP